MRQPPKTKNASENRVPTKRILDCPLWCSCVWPVRVLDISPSSLVVAAHLMIERAPFSNDKSTNALNVAPIASLLVSTLQVSRACAR